ncbi:MAG: haloacid dehalogenase [Planctomycetaceae bacterium]|nr:haloacid dehalogenase [Planctomycetaceae bacterium]
MTATLKAHQPGYSLSSRAVQFKGFALQILLFDIDGTLLNSGGAGQRAMERALETQYGITKPTEGISTAGRTDRAITVDMLNFHGVGDQIDATWKNFLAAYIQELPHTMSECDGIVLPGVPDLLEKLASLDDVELGLLTGNFREGARCKLEHFDLWKYFDFGGYGDIHPDRDDVARDALAVVHERFGSEIHPNQVWVIGDTAADVKCGRAIEANVIGVGTGNVPRQSLIDAKPDWFFEDFSELDAFLELVSRS